MASKKTPAPSKPEAPAKPGAPQAEPTVSTPKSGDTLAVAHSTRVRTGPSPAFMALTKGDTLTVVTSAPKRGEVTVAAATALRSAGVLTAS